MSLRPLPALLIPQTKDVNARLWRNYQYERIYKTMDLIKLSDAWNDFLQKEGYDLWLTITFKYETSAVLARRKIVDFFSHLNTKDRKFFDKSIMSFMYFEVNDDRKGVHLHAVVKGINPIRVSELETLFRQRFGFSEVKPTHAGVAKYLVEKDIRSHEVLADWDLIKINSLYRYKKPRQLEFSAKIN